MTDRVWRKSSYSDQQGNYVEVADPRWRKSTFSGTQGNCVEVAKNDDLIALRNSNHPETGTIYFTRDEMSAWIKGCKAGEFDDMLS